MTLMVDRGLGQKRVLAFQNRRVPESTLRIPFGWSSRSNQNLVDHLTGDVGQPEIASLESVRQPFVINSQAAEDRSLHIVDVHGILYYVVAIIVSLAVADARLYPAPSHPDAEA